MVFLVRSTDASTIARALQSFLKQKQLHLRKLIVKGYDGAVHLLGSEVEFIREFRPPLHMQFKSTFFLVTGFS